MSTFQVTRSGLAQTRIVEDTSNDMALADGEILVKVDRFGFSANNITYGIAGDTLGYWQFFPVEDDSQTWGVIPVWGFADVIESNGSSIEKGERLFGYFPPADTVIMKPVDIRPGMFFEGAGHRAELPRAYNSYQRVLKEPGYDTKSDNARMLLFPLYLTSFALWDQLKENDWYGAEQIVLLSASSKTALGLAYALSGDSDAPDCVGLTSPRNTGFVEKTGAFDSVLSYADRAGLKNVPSAIVDMSGNADLLGALHQQLGENMRHTLSVGLTHHESERRSKVVIKDRTEFFFAPSRIQKRMKEWGADEFRSRSNGSIMETAAKSQAWLKFETLAGLEGLNTVFADVRDGTMAPDRGLIVQM